MKILFVGSLIKSDTLDAIVRKSRVKPSNSAVNFENMLIKGLTENGVDVDVISLPTVSTYPGGSIPFWGSRVEQLGFGLQAHWIPCINLPFLKQLTARVNCAWMVFAWLLKNRKNKDKIIFNYSIYPPYSTATIHVARLFEVKTSSIITDLPEALYQMRETHGLKKKLADYYSSRMKRLQSGFDYYVLLTEPMIQELGLKDKPHIIMEGMSDPAIFENITDQQKNCKKTIMYSGALSKSFNIQALIDGFMLTEGDYQLWLFGYGDLISYIQECEKKDPRMHYFGKVDRDQLLAHQKMAHLLVSTKSPAAFHADYAFPSKILEYMTSGTAVASTMVGGIPKEYFEYIYPIQGDTAEAVAQSFREILQKSDKELCEKGMRSREYAVSQKNYRIQTKRIADFFRNCVNT